MFFIDQNQLIATKQNNVDKMSVLISNIFSNLEQLTTLNIKAAELALDSCVTSNRLFLERMDDSAPISLEAELIQPLKNWFLSYFSSMYEIGKQNRLDITAAFEDQMVELNTNIARSLEQVSAGVAGSEMTVSALKATVTAFNSAYENMSTAGKQVADIFDAYVMAIADSNTGSGFENEKRFGISERSVKAASKARSPDSQKKQPDSELKRSD